MNSSNNKVLLVDTNRAAVPIYNSLISQGFEVTVVGGNPNDTLAKMTNEYVQLDYSDTSALRNLIEQNQYDFIVPGCTDLSYKVCSKIGDGKLLGIDTEKNTNILNNKDLFRAFCHQLTIPIPQTLTLEQASKNNSIIVKPVDSFSGRGISVLKYASPKDIKKAFEKASKASKTQTALIEEFVAGQLYSYSAFIKNRKVVVDFFVQEDSSTNPFTVDTSRVIDKFDSEIHKNLTSNIESISAKLNLVDGLVHTQFIENNGQYWIIEMTRRCPGDIYSLLIQLSTGYAYAKNYAASFIGKTIQTNTNQQVNERIIRHTITSTEGEMLWGFQFQQPIEIKLFIPLLTAGDFIKPSPYGRAGVFFLKAQTADEQEEIYQKLVNRKFYRLGY